MEAAICYSSAVIAGVLSLVISSTAQDSSLGHEASSTEHSKQIEVRLQQPIKEQLDHIEPLTSDNPLKTEDTLLLHWTQKPAEDHRKTSVEDALSSSRFQYHLEVAAYIASLALVVVCILVVVRTVMWAVLARSVIDADGEAATVLIPQLHSERERGVEGDSEGRPRYAAPRDRSGSNDR